KPRRSAQLTGKVTGDIHEVAAPKTGLAAVFFVQQNHASAVMHATVPVFKTIDGSVVLIVAANRHHQKLAGFQPQARKRSDRELRLSAGCREHAIANRIGKLEAARLAHALIELPK